MPKLTQKDIRAMADQWADLNKKIAAVEKKRNAELHPHKVAYEEVTRPVIEKWDAKLDPLQDKADALET